jgi:predicted TIM-barrel fold metal-dependent hydrolase
MNASSGDDTAASSPIVDTHHHLWDLDRFRYDWLAPGGRADIEQVLGDYGEIRHDYLVEDLIGDYRGANVVKSVHVQADISEADPVVETAWLQGISDSHGFPHAIIASTDLRSEQIEAELERHGAFAGLRGIRMPESDDLLSDASFRRGVGALAVRGLSLEADVPARYMPELRSLAEAFPDMRFFLGHTGFPEQRSDSYFKAWRSAIRDVAGAQNVVVKISGLGMGDHRWSIESIRPWVMEAIEAFGPERCVFGTNWPVDRLYSDMTMLIDAYRTLLGGFTRGEQDDLLRRNAERFYDI